MAKLFVLLSALIGFQAHASSIVCSNGTIDEAGDAFYQISILEDGIEFSPYEGSYTVDIADVNVAGDVMEINDVTVTKFVEGTEESVRLNAVLRLRNNNTKLYASVQEDDGIMNNYTLDCKTKK